jgi:hypothetical protein
VPFSLIACQIRHPFGALKSGGGPPTSPRTFFKYKKINLNILLYFTLNFFKGNFIPKNNKISYKSMSG